jgi:hypothetical protein
MGATRTVSLSSPELAASAAEATRLASEERSERIRLSAPLLLLGAASLACSYVLYSEAYANHATRIPIWVLALSVGLIASVGGTTSLLVGDYSGLEWAAEAEASEHLVVVGRAEWESIQTELAESRGRPTATATPSEIEAVLPDLPEWEEPERAERAPPEPIRPVLAPPAPMAVTHKIDSLATEVDRLVADLELAASQSPPPPRPNVTRPPAAVPPSARSTPAPAPAAAVPPSGPVSSPPPAVQASPTMPRPAPAAPRVPKAPVPAPSAPAPIAPTEPPTVVGEYNDLLAELEKRASTAIEAGALARPAVSDPGPVRRCVGCDAKLGPLHTDRHLCRSCRSPLCPNCERRATAEGHPGFCPVCSILEETGGA